MNTIRRNLTIVAAAGTVAAAAAFALPAFAQGPGDCPGWDGGPHARGQRPDPARMQQFATKRFDALHDALKLNASQEAAWKGYRDGILADMEAMAKNRPDPAALRDKPAPDRMAAMLEQSKAHQAMMEKHLAETRKFYDQLTPEQKKTFDAQAMMGPRHHPMRGPRGGAPAPQGGER